MDEPRKRACHEEFLRRCDEVEEMIAQGHDGRALQKHLVEKCGLTPGSAGVFMTRLRKKLAREHLQDREANRAKQIVMLYGIIQKCIEEERFADAISGVRMAMKITGTELRPETLNQEVKITIRDYTAKESDQQENR